MNNDRALITSRPLRGSLTTGSNNRLVRILAQVLRWKVAPYPVDFLFFVYGTEEHRRKMLPGFLGRWVGNAIFPGGTIQVGPYTGYVAVTFVDHNELRDRPDLVLPLLERVPRAFVIKDTGAVALAGQVPGWLFRAGGTIAKPFVSGHRGTRYAMLRAAEHLARQETPEGVDLKELTVAVLGGAGFTGGAVARDLGEVFGRIIAYDTKHIRGKASYSTGDSPAFVDFTDDPNKLKNADLVLNFLPKGDDAEPLIPYLRSGVVFGDDTHPMMYRRVRKKLCENGIIYRKLVMGWPEHPLVYSPVLPDFEQGQIPGCLLEALVTRHTGSRFDVSPGGLDSHEDTTQQNNFNRLADSLGFEPRLSNPDSEHK